MSKRPEPPSPTKSTGSILLSPSSPTGIAARSAAPGDKRQRMNAPGTMLDKEPVEARLPGYTGHRPGLISEALCGRSYAYLTGFRKNYFLASAQMSTYKRAHGCEAHRFEPRCVLRHTENAPRHLVLGLDAECVNRPTTAGPRADPRSQWQTRQQFYSTLDLSPTGHMPGYTGHISQYKYSNPGQRFAKSTMGSLPSSHPSLSVELFRG